ncbi:hypothetical protein J6590_040740 [Homalodisca vitripennis]|nr:hypothetical protein J6590_040740 [Homalodisca vitripennis]
MDNNSVGNVQSFESVVAFTGIFRSAVWNLYRLDARPYYAWLGRKCGEEWRVELCISTGVHLLLGTMFVVVSDLRLDSSLRRYVISPQLLLLYQFSTSILLSCRELISVALVIRLSLVARCELVFWCLGDVSSILDSSLRRYVISPQLLLLSVQYSDSAKLPRADKRSTCDKAQSSGSL